MRRPVFLSIPVLLAAATMAVAGATYRWVDEQGQVHFSDQPHAGAEKYNLAPAQSYSAPAAPAPRSAAPPAAAQAVTSSTYDRCEIVQPANDEVLADQAVTVRGTLSPSPRQGDRTFLQFDSATMEAPAPGQLEFRIEPVERGTHTVALLVRDAAGHTLCQSQPVTFHRREASVLAPLNPNNPANQRKR